MSFLPFHIDWLLVLSGAATVGIPAALVLYSVKRMRDLSGPHMELEPQHLINIVLAFPTGEESLQALELLVRRADFRSPQMRRIELSKLKSWLADQDLSSGDGYSLILRQPSGNLGTAGPEAEKLAEKQIRRLETSEPMIRSNRPQGDAPWCVLGVVGALAVSAAEGLTDGSGIRSACQSHDALKSASDIGAAMDAFYIFYSPAPQERLTQADARRITADLQAIARHAL